MPQTIKGHTCPIDANIICPGQCLFKDIFDCIRIGVIIYYYKADCILLHNTHGRTLLSAKDTRKFISRVKELIMAQTGEREPAEIRDVMHIDTRIIGFSIHRVKADAHYILYRDVTSTIINELIETNRNMFAEYTHFLSEILHEMGNSISSLKTMHQVLLDNFNRFSSKKHHTYLTQASKEIVLIEKFLDSLRPMARDRILDLRDYHLNSLVQEVVFASHLPSPHPVVFQFYIPADLFVRVDKSAFHQICNNLVKNSMEISNGPCRISIQGVFIKSGFIELDYRDNGPGFSEDQSHHIFSPFYSTKSQNSGLGLTITRKLMVSMGGTIEALATGQGARFRLLFPTSRQAAIAAI